MAWDPDDVARSIRRYLSGTLEAPPWRLRTERREVRDDDRPVGVIDIGEVTVTRAREGVLEQGEVEWLLPVTVSCYPEIEAKEKEGRHEAELLRAQLLRWIQVGLTVQADGRDFAGPFRIPLYDYSQTDLSGAAKAGPTEPHDVLFVPRQSLSSAIIQDLEDSLRFTVICEFQATVEMPGRVPPDAPPVTEIYPVPPSPVWEGYVGPGHPVPR